MTHIQVAEIKNIKARLELLRNNELKVAELSPTGADAENNHDALQFAIQSLEEIVYSE